MSMNKLQSIDKRETKHLRTYYYYVVTTCFLFAVLNNFLKFIEYLHNLQYVRSNVP